MDTITSFTREHRFLSNFWRVLIKYNERTYPTVEHAYQAAKIDPRELNYTQMCREIRSLLTPGLAKRYGRNVPMRPDWNKQKLEIMIALVRQKFEQPDLAEMLIATSPAILIEVNNWDDCYWGICNGQGANHLGNILMVTRGELMRKRKSYLAAAR